MELWLEYLTRRRQPPRLRVVASYPSERQVWAFFVASQTALIAVCAPGLDLSRRTVAEQKAALFRAAPQLEIAWGELARAALAEGLPTDRPPPTL